MKSTEAQSHSQWQAMVVVAMMVVELSNPNCTQDAAHVLFTFPTFAPSYEGLYRLQTLGSYKSHFQQRKMQLYPILRKIFPTQLYLPEKQ